VPVPLAVSVKSVLSVVVVITLPSIRMSSTSSLGTVNLVESIVAIVLLSTMNLITLSFAPSVSSAVTRVVPSKSSTPLRLTQLVPLYPSNLLNSVLNLSCPLTAVGRSDVYLLVNPMLQLHQ